jgi:hypothetical protein
MAHHPIATGYLGISLFGPLVAYVKVPGQPLNVPSVDIDTVIATAIGRAFRTIEEDGQRTAIRTGVISV